MRSCLVIVLVACLGFMNACKKSGNAGRETSLQISIHDCAHPIFSDNGTRLCFDSVVEDSRCPSNAECIWQGVAVCKFSFLTNGKTHSFTLSTLSSPGFYNKEIIISGYKIEFINLTPYPVLPPAPPPGHETKAEVMITKL
jgi:hypothetical protein